MTSRILLRRGTAAQWASANPILGSGELGVETDTLKFKIGNGTSTWTQLTNYINVTPSGLSNSLGDYILLANQGNAGGPAELDSNGDLLIPENSAIFWNDPAYSYTTTLTTTQPTANRVITFPNATGTVALTSDITSAVTNLINAAPSTLDTLNELAAAINNDSSFSTTVNNLLSGKVSKSGGDTIVASTASTVGLIIKGATSQTANLLEFKDSSGVVVGKYNSSYQMTVGSLQATVGDVQARYGIYGGGTGYLGALSIVSWAANIPTAVLRGYASQTANLTEWQNSAGTVLAKVDASGIGTFAQASFAGGAATIDGGGGAALGAIYTGALKGSPTSYNFFSNVTGSPYATVVVKQLSGQTTDLQQWQDSTGTVAASINSGGSLSLSRSLYTSASLGVWASVNADPQGGSTGNALTVQTYNTTSKGIVIKGVASQTANLQEWQNSAGTVLASISSAGKLISTVDASINGVTVGMGAGSASTNTVTGLNALISNTTGTYNTAFGNQSLQLNTSGTQNTAFGQGALYNNRTGWYNTAFGQGALQQNNYAYSNTAIGANAMVNNVSGSANTALGIQSLLLNLSGNNNIGLGTNAGFSNSTGSGNIFLGYESGYYETGSNKLYIANSNTATPLIGGDFSANTLTFAGNATVVSQAAATVGLIVKGATSQTADLQQWQTSTGQTNLSINFGGALQSYIQTTADNINSGITSFIAKTSYANVKPMIVMGAASQTANLQEWQDSAGTIKSYIASDGSFSSSMDATINSLTIGRGGGNQISNVAIGLAALLSNTTGVGNTQIGLSSGQNITTGSYNVGVGNYTNLSLTTGTTNTSIGTSAGSTITTGSNITVLGYDAEPSSPTISNEITLGNASVTKLRIPGIGVDWTSSALNIGSNRVLTSQDEKNIYITDSGTARTLGSSDAYKILEFTSSSSITVTIPNDASDTTFPIGSYVEVRQMGGGQITVSATSPATLVATDNQYKTRVQYSAIVLEKRASNAWYLAGDTTA